MWNEENQDDNEETYAMREQLHQMAKKSKMDKVGDMPIFLPPSFDRRASE